MLPWVADERLVPPVALLGYLPSDVSRAAFWPLAEFSPGVAGARWAVRPRRARSPRSTCRWRGRWHRRSSRTGCPTTAILDPLGALAAAAGEPDAERWWEDVVEHRGDGTPAFAAVAAAMAAVRGGTCRRRPSEAVREAHMRTAIRAALAGRPRRRRRVRRLARAGARPGHDDGRRRPRIAARSVGVAGRPPRRRSPGCRGPIAGCSSAPATPPASPHPAGTATSSVIPGRQGVARFFVDAAAALRSHGLAASPDHLIAASRLADALAALRGRPRSGLAEVLDAASAVLSLSAGEAVGRRDRRADGR